VRVFIRFGAISVIAMLAFAAACGRVPADGTDAPETPDAPTGRIADGESVSTDEMKAARQLHPMIVLSDGRVLAVGGRGVGVAEGFAGVNAKVDLYDPATGLWTPTGPLAKERQDPILFELPDGTVIAAGGMATNFEFPATTEIYDPTTGQWSPGPEMNSPRETPAAVQLADGRIFVSGGLHDRDLVTVATSEIYDPATGTWTETAPMAEARQKHVATLLADGRVLITTRRPLHQERRNIRPRNRLVVIGRGHGAGPHAPHRRPARRR